MGGIKMPYKEVSLDTKIDVIKDFLAGMKVAHIARKYDVSRDSVYTWKNIALDSMENALQTYQTDEVDQLKSKLAKLEDEYQKLSEEYEELSQQTQLTVSTTPSQEVRPSQCPDCASENIIKNGSYETKAGVKQRFRCKDCNKRIFIVKKNRN